jgi:hypothetical protein
MSYLILQLALIDAAAGHIVVARTSIDGRSTTMERDT